MFEHLLAGFAGAVIPHNLLFMVVGVAIGIFGGAMPGVAASTIIALLLPFTFGMAADTSLILLTASYVGAEYGGSISAIFINTPGTPGAIMTTLDGYQMTKRGFPVKALCASLVPSTVGGLIGNVALILIAVPLANFALRFGPSEYFALGVFGLSIVATLTGDDWRKGVLSAGIGLFLVMIGTDQMTGFPRFTFGQAELLSGVSLVPMLIGFLALPEVLLMIEEIGEKTALPQKLSHAFPTWQEWKATIPATIRGSLIGIAMGTIPGHGSTISSIIAYNEERRASKHPEKFGTGVIEGVAAPEAANNAVVGGSLIPTLTLGIPGSGSMAVLLGALTLHGLEPGPGLFQHNADVIFNLFASQFLANIALLIIGLIGMTWWVRVIEVPRAVLAPCIVALCFIGAYSVSGNLWDVGTVLVCGIIGYGMRKLNFPVAPAVLALILGNIAEYNYRRMLLVSGGNLLEPLMHPITAIFLVLAVITFVWPIYRHWKTVRRQSSAA
jgi:putative tricarboxylic transport membrane protein